jgi:hypothetical protein
MDDDAKNNSAGARATPTPTKRTPFHQPIPFFHTPPK